MISTVICGLNEATRTDSAVRVPAPFRVGSTMSITTDIRTKRLNQSPMNQIPMYPFRFEPIYQYRIWGGRRLSNFLSAPLPGDGPIGEAWVLSDRDDFPSVVADGPLKGSTIEQLNQASPEQLMGRFAGRFNRFPLLMKFLDARDVLSVQVHPSDQQTDYLPKGEQGKTEAWLVLEAGSESRIYAGLKPGVTPADFRQRIDDGSVADALASFTPSTGDGILLKAGTVHTMGGLVVFEVQQNSDVTFRLYDWGHVDAKTGQPRPLHIDQGMACIDFTRGPVGPVAPIVEAETPVLREKLFLSDYFVTWRLTGDSPVIVGEDETPRVLVCLDGEAQLEHEGVNYPMRKGDVLLLPAVVGSCFCQPIGKVCFLEIAIPDPN